MADDPLRDLWIDEEDEMIEIDMALLRTQHADLQRTVTRRNQTEVFAAGLVVAWFASRAMLADTVLGAAGAAAVAVGAAFVAWTIARRGQPLEALPSADTRTFVAQRRAELLHQADLLARVPVWYLGPFVPGFALLAADRWPGWGTDGVLAWSGALAVMVAFFVGVAWMNLAASRSLRAEAEALPDVS